MAAGWSLTHHPACSNSPGSSDLVRLDVISIFPEYLAALDISLIGKARRDGLIDLVVHDLRDFTHDRHRTVDDTPYGGGAGMVMKPEVWSECLTHIVAIEAEPLVEPHRMHPRDPCGDEWLRPLPERIVLVSHPSAGVPS